MKVLEFLGIQPNYPIKLKTSSEPKIVYIIANVLLLVLFKIDDFIEQNIDCSIVITYEP